MQESPALRLHPLDQEFIDEFSELKIIQGTILRSVTGTLRRVDAVVFHERGYPLRVETTVLSEDSRNPEKTAFTVREVVLGRRKALFQVLLPRAPIRY